MRVRMPGAMRMAGVVVRVLLRLIVPVMTIVIVVVSSAGRRTAWVGMFFMRVSDRSARRLARARLAVIRLVKVIVWHIRLVRAVLRLTLTH